MFNWIIIWAYFQAILAMGCDWNPLFAYNSKHDMVLNFVEVEILHYFIEDHLSKVLLWVQVSNACIEGWGGGWHLYCPKSHVMPTLRSHWTQDQNTNWLFTKGKHNQNENIFQSLHLYNLCLHLLNKEIFVSSIKTHSSTISMSS